MFVHRQRETVPLVFQDLRPQESYLQAADALARLEELADRVFGSIQTRVQAERSRLQHVGGRLAVAQSKIEQVAGQTSRATTVISPAQYPAPPSVPVMPPVFSEASAATHAPETVVPARRLRHKVLRDAPHLPTDLAARPPTSPQETVLDEMFVTLDRFGPGSLLGEKEGLGRLPPNLPSISNLLLFNTGDNPYKSYVSLDNLAAKKKTGREGHDESDKKLLADAPTTFKEGDVLPAVATLDYDYKPVLGDVPEMNLPSMLPNLTGVADLTFAQGSGSASIAPSAVPGDVLPDLAPAAAPAPRNTSADTSASAAAPPPAPTAPAPPPPPSAPPAPPPPDFPAAGLQDDAPGSAPSAPPPEGVPKIEPTRGGLLADIRKGHKGRLKSAAKRKMDDTPKKPKKEAAASSASAAPSGGTGDIFGDLMQALNRRRAGIAATRDAAETKSAKAEADSDAILPPSMDAEWDE